jgi:hypothetical protein
MKRVRWRKEHMMEKIRFNNVTVPDITVRWMEDAVGKQSEEERAGTRGIIDRVSDAVNYLQLELYPYVRLHPFID